jgi:hypothetical protein
MLATAAGIAVYWATWFRTPHEQAWLPAGYHEHERVFVFPDCLLATLLTVTAVLTITEQDLAPRLGLVAAGMLTFLGVIDLAYFAQHGLFAREREGLLNLFLVVAVLVLAAVLVAVGLR